MATSPAPSPALPLLSLPVDVILTILSQPTVSARDLCCLEQTCTAVRALITEDASWQRLFLREHKPPALAAPSDWKSEYARRHDVARSWRQRGEFDPDVPISFDSSFMPPITRCIAPAVRACPAPKKLRKLALMMLPNGLHPHGAPGDGAHPLLVDPNAPGHFPTIGAAIACARPQDTIWVAPGTYTERLLLDKSIDIIGTGPIGSVKIVGVDGPVIQVSLSRTAARVAKMTIDQRASPEGAPMSGAVRVEGGAVLVLEECTVTSSSGHCIVVKGAESCAHIAHNEVCNARGVGVLVCDHARALVEDNDVYSNERAGVAILSGGNPLVRNNKIHDGKDSGVLVSEKGRGRIEENHIFANQRAGVAILREGAPLVSRNKIFGGHDSGVLVCDNGMGSVVDNAIYSNHMAGVAIGHGGASTVKGNTIRDGSGGSLLCLSSHSKGLICANVIDQDAGAALQVPDGLLPEVQEQNLIRFIGQVQLSC